MTPKYGHALIIGAGQGLSASLARWRIDTPLCIAHFVAQTAHETAGFRTTEEFDRVHDSTADMRYLVLPARPAGTEGWDEARLAGIITRDCMIGTAVPGV